MLECSEAWIDAIAAFVLFLRAGGKPATTIYLRNYQLRRLAAAIEPRAPWEVPADELVLWFASQDWAHETLRSYRSAVRSFYAWGVRQGYLSAQDNPALALPVVPTKPPCPRPAPADVLREALSSPEDRVRLMVRLASELGMRRGEVARTHTDWLERDHFGWSLRVLGKGGRTRVIPIGDDIARAIRQAGPGFIFPGRVEGHLSAAWVGKLVSRAMPGAWTMHTLRHRFATVAFSIDRDLLTVQQLLGHGSPATTQLYIRLPDDALRRTVAAVGRAS